MRDTRPAHRSLVYSDRHMYSMSFQRIGGRNVAHTNIHPKQSPASLAFNCSAHVTPLPDGRGQRMSIAGLTPHPSASGSCEYVTHTPTLTRPSRWRRVPRPVVDHT